MSSAEPHWGVWLHAVRPAAELARLAAATEALGAAAVLVADEGTDRDLFVTLAVLAQHTRRVLLFGAVTNPHSRHPLATAAAFASLAELAPGRIVAGFGAGGSRVLTPMGLSPRRPYSALVECVGVVDALLGGETVDHQGEFAVRGAALPWSPGHLPLAIAGRGPRVERFAARRADWILLAGRAIQKVPALVEALRLLGRGARRRPPAIAWNPNVAWTDAMSAEMRAHLAYMLVDMPGEDRAALGVDDDRIAELRVLVNSSRPVAAAALVPDTVLERYAIAGDREHVLAGLSDVLRQVQPELLLFDAYDYSTAFLESVAALAMDAGAVASRVMKNASGREKS